MLRPGIKTKQEGTHKKCNTIKIRFKGTVKDNSFGIDRKGVWIISRQISFLEFSITLTTF